MRIPLPTLPRKALIRTESHLYYGDVTYKYLTDIPIITNGRMVIVHSLGISVEYISVYGVLNVNIDFLPVIKNYEIQGKSSIYYCTKEAIYSIETKIKEL